LSSSVRTGSRLGRKATAGRFQVFAGRGWGRWFASFPGALICLSLVAMPEAAPAAKPRNVLVLYSNGRLLPANIEVDRGLVQGFAARPDLQVELSAEFLDSPRFGGETHERAVVAYLREKYAAHPPEVILVGAWEALDFTLRNRERMFARVPVVHLAVSSEDLQSTAPLPPDVIGVPLRLDFLGTVEQALRWQPAARRLVVVTGSSTWDREWEARLRAQATRLEDRLSLEFLSGLATAELQTHLRALGGDSIVFTPGFFSDGDGRVFVPREAARLIAAAATAPVYSLYATFIGTGIVGGRMASYDAIGRVGAHATLELLSGAAPASLNLPETMPMPLHIDWREARRRGIAADAVPPDAIVKFREPSFWEAYRRWVLIAGAVMLLQAGLIAALLVERRRRQRTAAALARTERHMSLAARAARLSMWIWDTGTGRAGTIEPPPLPAATAPGPLADFAQVLARIHPQDRDEVVRVIGAALASGEEFDVEYRVTGPDGALHWQSARGSADQDQGRLIGVAIDITQRKRAEVQAEQDHAALQHMTRVSLLGQLSASIAHQLNQPLAAILGNAEAARTMLGRDPVDLPELRDICDDIVADDHRAAAVIRRLGALFKRGEPLLASLDVNELVRDTAELLRTNLLTRHVALVTQLAPALPRIDGDRVQLQQMLLNLIVNAADATELAAPDRRVVTVGTESDRAGIRLCVADRGPGVPAEALDKVFEPFWSTKDDGMGIGLAVCRSIVVEHRGSLVVTNSPEGGAVFCALLPARETP
jgi:signal transduction histidine kinase